MTQQGRTGKGRQSHVAAALLAAGHQGTPGRQHSACAATAYAVGAGQPPLLLSWFVSLYQRRAALRSLSLRVMNSFYYTLGAARLRPCRPISTKFELILTQEGAAGGAASHSRPIPF